MTVLKFSLANRQSAVSPWIYPFQIHQPATFSTAQPEGLVIYFPLCNYTTSFSLGIMAAGNCVL